MNLSDIVSQVKPSTFVELQLTELILFKINEGLSKLTPLVEFAQVIEKFLKRESFYFHLRKSNPASAKMISKL